MKTKRKRKSKWTRIEPGLYRRSDGGLYIHFTHKGVAYNAAAGTKLKTARTMLYNMRERARLDAVGLKSNDYSIKKARNAYMAHCKQHLKSSTVENYRLHFKTLFGYFNFVEKVSDLKPLLITDYIEHRRTVGGVSDRTIGMELVILKAMLKFAERSGLIARNPLQHVQPLRQRDKAFRRALSEEEFERLLNHIHHRGSRAGKCKSWRPCQCRDIWLMLGETGIRKGELTALRWEDVDFARSEIVVRGHNDDDGPKTTASNRCIPMSERVHGLLEERAKSGAEGRVFTTIDGTPIGNNLRRKLRACLKAAGIDGHGVTVHSLRYSFASWLVQRGAPLPAVKDLLGHTDVRMTLRVYTQTLSGDKEKAISLLSRKHGHPKDGLEPNRHASVTPRKGFQLGIA